MSVNGANSTEVAGVVVNGPINTDAKVVKSKEGGVTSLSRTTCCLPRNYLTSPEAKKNYDVRNRDFLNTYQHVNLQNATENVQKNEGPVATQGKDIESDNPVQANTAVAVQETKHEGFKAKMLARLKVIEDFINSILIALHIKKAPNSGLTNAAPLLNTNQPIPQEAIRQQPEVKEPIDQQAKVEEPINQQPEVDSEQIPSEDVEHIESTVKAWQDLAEELVPVRRACNKIKEVIARERDYKIYSFPKGKQQEVNQAIDLLKDKVFDCNKSILKSLVSFISNVYGKKNEMSGKDFQEMSKGGIKLQDLLNDLMKELAPASRVDDFLNNFEVNRSACPKELVACYDDAMKAIEENNYADQKYQNLKAKNVSEEELDVQGKIVDKTHDEANDLLNKLGILARAHLFFEGLNEDEIGNFKSFLNDAIKNNSRESIEPLKLLLASLDPAFFKKVN